MKLRCLCLLAGTAMLTFVGCRCKTEPHGNATYDTIMTRTSVRSFTDQQVTVAQIDTMLHAAMAAPTAVNKQPWCFLVVDDRAMLDSIVANFPSMKMAQTASVAILMCGNMEAALDGEAREYWTQDVSAATENLLLAAHSMGLGAVWCGIYPISERVATFSRIFNMPGNIVPMACVCVGYPDGENTPKDKWKPEKVYYNTWGNTKN